jgi:hypothetical protein
MRKFLLRGMSFSVLVFLLSGFTRAAWAMPITAGVYSLSGTSADGYTLTGDLTFGSNGYVTAADLSFNDSAVGDPSFTHIDSEGGPAGYNPVADYAYISGKTGQVALYYLATLTAAGDIELCILNTSCNAYQASYVQIYTPSGFNGNGMADLSAGSVNPADGPLSPTPEPSSLALLGTAVLCAAGVARWRLSRS